MRNHVKMVGKIWISRESLFFFGENIENIFNGLDPPPEAGRRLGHFLNLDGVPREGPPWVRPPAPRLCSLESCLRPLAPVFAEEFIVSTRLPSFAQAQTPSYILRQSQVGKKSSRMLSASSPPTDSLLTNPPSFWSLTTPALVVDSSRFTPL